MKSSGRIGELDSLRGIAALLVVCFHMAMFRPENEYGFFLGVTGVEFFFLISGFVIFKSVSVNQSVRTFIRSRFVRLFPTYWLAASLTFLAYSVLIRSGSPVPYVHYTADDYFFNLSMIQYYFGYPNLAGAYWSLLVELIFYGVLICFLLLGKVKQAIYLLMVIAILTALSAYVIDEMAFQQLLLWAPILPYLPYFLIGMIFFKLGEKEYSNFKAWSLIAVASVCMIMTMNYTRSFQFTGSFWFLCMLTLYIVFFSLLINHKLSWMNQKPMVWMGEISYALYLVHQPICYVLIVPYFTDILGWNFWLVSFGMALPVSIFVAAVITRFFDRPVRLWLTAQFKRIE